MGKGLGPFLPNLRHILKQAFALSVCCDDVGDLRDLKKRRVLIGNGGDGSRSIWWSGRLLLVKDHDNSPTHVLSFIILAISTK